PEGTGIPLCEAAVGAVVDVSVLDVGVGLVHPAHADAADGARAGRQPLVVVLGVHQDAQGHLLQVALAGGGTRLLPSLGEDGEQNGRKDSDDGDDNEELDQGETARPWHFRLPTPTLPGPDRRGALPAGGATPRPARSRPVAGILPRSSQEIRGLLSKNAIPRL